MSEDEKKSDEHPAWWSAKRIYQFGRNVVTLENSVSQLKEENRNLRVQVRSLQAQVERMSGQMEVLIRFVEGSVEARVDSRVDRRVATLLLASRKQDED